MASYIRRRKFLATLLGGGAAAWPLAARAQQPATSTASDTLPDRLRGFRQGLKDTGYVEGENVATVMASAVAGGPSAAFASSMASTFACTAERSFQQGPP